MTPFPRWIKGGLLQKVRHSGMSLGSGNRVTHARTVGNGGWEKPGKQGQGMDGPPDGLR